MKTIKLSLIILFVGLTSAVFAQTGQTPYLNSEQTYTVTMADATNNTPSWVIADKDGTPLATQPDMTATKDDVTNVATLKIVWADSWAVLSPDGLANYQILFRETKAGTGCIALRKAEITVQRNTFFLVASGEVDACNDSNNKVLAQGALGETTLVFNVTLDDVTFDLKAFSWKFDFDLVLTGTDYSIIDVKVDGSAAPLNYEGVSVVKDKKTVPVTVIISGPVNTAANLTMTVSNGKAINGAVVINDKGDGTKVHSVNVNALPDTSEISFN